MKIKKVLFSLLSILILVSCSSSTEPIENNELSVKLKKESMKITNKLDETVYLFVVDRDVANVIDWIPSYNDPKVESNGTIEIKYSEVAGIEMSHSTNNDILIYYWTKTNKEFPHVESIIVTPNN